MTLASVSWLVACTIVLFAPVAAADSQERAQLNLIVRQFDAVERLADRAQVAADASDSARYRFDYAQFTHDLQRVRQGIHAYLSPSRAQPADLIELPADYRHDATSVGNAHEHD